MNRKQLLRYSAAVIVFILGMSLFFSLKSYPLASSSDKILTNGYVLRDVVPEQVYDYTLSKISRWRNSNAPAVKVYTITNQVTPDNDGYSFTIQADGQDEVYIHVAVKNYGNFFSIGVTINGKTQDIS